MTPFRVRIRPSSVRVKWEFAEHLQTSLELLLDVVADLSVSLHGGPDDDGGNRISNVIQMRKAA